VTRINGVSSLNMIRALREEDKLSRKEISELAKGKLKKKVDALEKALDGRLTDHHRFLLRMHLENILYHAEDKKAG
jgi:transposase